MIRRALIVYCDNTESGRLPGPVADKNNLVNHLTSKLGGNWDESTEIGLLNNPTRSQVKSAVNGFLSSADYSLFVFSGHGYMNADDNNTQYMELSDYDISIMETISNAPRQTIIIDACRGIFSPSEERLSKGLRGFSESFTGDPDSTRELFEQEVMACEEGITVLYAADANQTAADSNKGGAYLFSILKVCELWSNMDRKHTKFSVKNAHDNGTTYMRQNFITRQNPTMNIEKRMRYYPLAVKFIPIYG